jgi:hypothetical protein
MDLEARKTLYVVLAAILCFGGPTYFISIIHNVIPQAYAMTLGFICFLIGIYFIFRFVKE